jgi:DNA-binding MarR family transcriptional regulator
MSDMQPTTMDTKYPPHETDEPGYKRVTPEIAANIVRIKRANPHARQADIAAAVGVTQGTVSRWLSALEQDTTEEANKLYAANQLRAAQAVINRLEDDDSRVVLKAAELAHKVGKLLDSDNQVKVGVQVVIGMPNLPTETVIHNAPYQTQKESVGYTGQALTATDGSAFVAKVEGESAE